MRPIFFLDHHVQDELSAHRDKVFAALSQHSDPSLREIGRLLASGTPSPDQLINDSTRGVTARRAGRKASWIDRKATHVVGGPRPGRSNEAGPASRADNTDPDNGAGGVPAIRR